MSKATEVAKKAVRSSVSGINPLVLSNCAQLSHLDTTDLVRLSKVAEVRFLVEGEVIYRRGQTADSVFMLLDGVVRLQRSTEEGLAVEHEVEVAYTTFGDLGLLGEEGRRYDASAGSDSLVAELPLTDVLEVLEANPPQGVAWRGSILARLHRMEPGETDTFGWKILHKLSQLAGAA